MKRVLTVITILVCLFSWHIAYANTPDSVTYIVEPKLGVNVRDAVEDGAVIKVIRGGEPVEVTGETRFKYKVRLEDGTTGYIYKKYLHVGHAEELEAIENRRNRKVNVDNSWANLIGRINSDCSVYKTANGKIIDEFKVGDIVFIRQTGQFWYRIIYQNSEVAWIQSKNVDIVDVNAPGEGTVYVLRDTRNSGTSKVDIRTEPNIKSKVLKTVKMGYHVRVLEEVNNVWAKVSYDSNGSIGYVRRCWLKKTDVRKLKKSK